MAAQVAAQTGQTAEGVSSHAVESGEKFSFARLRQAIDKKSVSINAVSIPR